MSAMQFIKAHVPVPIKQKLKDWLRAGGHPLVPAIKGQARVLDLYVWVADGKIDTLIPIHNYFSVLFPDIGTATSAHIEVLASDGRTIGEKDIAVPRMATPTVSVAGLLREFGASNETFGNVVWDLHTPSAVHGRLEATGEPFLLWDRSYIGYVGGDGQVSFVHGIDKTWVVKDDNSRMSWPMRVSDQFSATPEIPLMLNETVQTDILVQNRGRKPRAIELQVRDQSGRLREWSVVLAPRGAHRFILDPRKLATLDIALPLILRVNGLPTRYGRAVVFRHFASGAFSAMHC